MVARVRSNRRTISPTQTGGSAPPPRIKPMVEMGVSGTPVWGGYIATREKSAKWTGTQRYVTIADMAVNTSIIAAGVRYITNMIAHPRWTVAPPQKFKDDPQAKAVAELVEEVIHDLERPWSRVVRKATMFMFYGFGIQEWTARRRPDGKIGLASVESRPQHTIERWSISETGAIEGVWQRSPQTGQLLGIPRSKFWYLADDLMTDSPEGTGVFRHLANPWERLKRYYKLEERAFERDLRGIPIGRIPYTAINNAVKSGALTAAQAENMVKAMEDFVQIEVKESNTSLTIDSAMYESQAADGYKIAAAPQWGLELLQGSANGIGDLANSINRTQHEMARIMACQHLLMGAGGSSGNRSLSEDMSRNLYLTANSVLTDVAAGADHDIIGPICMLNNVPEELYPTCEVEDVSFKDAEMVAQVLKDMATAGAVLAPDDPVVGEVRELMGVAPPPPVSPELAGLGGGEDELAGVADPEVELDEGGGSLAP